MAIGLSSAFPLSCFGLMMTLIQTQKMNVGAELGVAGVEDVVMRPEPRGLHGSPSQHGHRLAEYKKGLEVKFQS
jgi:hypothetical protein